MGTEPVNDDVDPGPLPEADDPLPGLIAGLDQALAIAGQIARVAYGVAERLLRLHGRYCVTKREWEAIEEVVAAVLRDERRETYVFTVDVRADTFTGALKVLSPLEGIEGVRVRLTGDEKP